MYKYLYSRHPKLQFLNFSEQCDLTIITHIQATGTNDLLMVGNSSAGSSQFTKNEARNRTICEVLERTALKELHIPTDKIWGSAVAPTIQLAKLLAIEECIERWITHKAFLNIANYNFNKINMQTLPQNGFVETILFEWEQYEAQIDTFAVTNPYNISVILIRIEVLVNDTNWTFFSNGIGNDYTQALMKAFLESIQFVPGKKAPNWSELKIENKRLNEWKTIELEFIENIVLYDPITNDVYYNLLSHIFNEIQGNINVCQIPECDNIYLGYANLHSQNWSQFKGIPIA